MLTFKARCIKASKTTTSSLFYSLTPVRKERVDNVSYNSSYTSQWKPCSLKECTSFKLRDDNNHIKYLKRDRFDTKELDKLFS